MIFPADQSASVHVAQYLPVVLNSPCHLLMQIMDAQPTALLTPLITTTGGVSLVFDPLIRKPSEVAAAIVNNIASGVNSSGR